MPSMSSKSVFTGTYLAEERTTQAGPTFVLQSASQQGGGLVRRLAHVHGPRKKPGARGRFDERKCIELPALKTIDPLLTSSIGFERKGVAVGDVRESKAKIRLPPVSEQTLNPDASNLEESARSSRVVPPGSKGSRLWHSERSQYRFGGTSQLVPTDDEFKGWLTHAHVGMGSRSPSTMRNVADVFDDRSATQSELAGEEQPSPRPNARYHIILLRKTFEDANNSASRVSSVLVQSLLLTPDEASKMVSQAQRKMFAPVQVTESQSYAFDAVHELRCQGLFVQVVSEVGLPEGHAGSRRALPAQVGYSDVIQNGLRNTNIAGQHRPAPPLILPPLGTTPASAWRRRQVPITVLPEDPVEAFFGAEEHEKEKVVARPRRPSLKASVKSLTDERHIMEALRELASEAEQASEAHTSKKVIVSKARKEASQLIRLFVFGAVGNEDSKAKEEKDLIYFETIGTKEQLRQLTRLWRSMDADASGRVDIGEFRSFAHDQFRELLLPSAAQASSEGVEQDKSPDIIPEWLHVGTDPAKEPGKFISRLVDKLAIALLGKKSSFVMEDIFRVIWPAASQAELRLMENMCKDFDRQAGKTRVKTPELLDPSEFDGLCSVFRHFDDKGKGELSFDELIAKGLIYGDQVEAYRRDWDRTGDGTLDMFEFCEMMCPLGFRAFPTSRVGSQRDGTRVLFDPQIGVWRLEAEFLHEQALRDSEVIALLPPEEKQLRAAGGFLFADATGQVIGFAAVGVGAPPPTPRTLLSLDGFVAHDGPADVSWHPVAESCLRAVGVEKFAWWYSTEEGPDTSQGGWVFELAQGMRILFPIGGASADVKLDEEQMTQAEEVRKYLARMSIMSFTACRDIHKGPVCSEWSPLKLGVELRRKLGIPNAAKNVAWVYAVSDPTSANQEVCLD